jgi:ferredoxin-NADP reductase/Na+-translocating ferredoxin:NAD+ oxidoreductase RnfD subunit
MKYINKILDNLTMYRTLLYFLVILLLAAMMFGAVGIMPYSPFAIAGSVAILVVECLVVNYIFARIYNTPTNTESSVLTALILALIITPPASVETVPFLLAAGGLAIASKYILAINHKHIFNPVAIAVVLTAFGPQETASWWVGNTWLLPFVLVGGLFIVRKVRKFKMVSLFLAVALAAIVVAALIMGRDAITVLQSTILHSSLLFLGIVMLTEPVTSPSTWSKGRWYAIIVGILYLPSLHVGDIYSTPELALVIGNVASFVMSPIIKSMITIKARYMYGSNTEDIVFNVDKKFKYQPGQYIEMTLPHSGTDSRGSRRYFTLASSPTEDDLRVGVRFYDPGSTFKAELQDAPSDVFASIGQLGGDFTLPKDSSQKLAFIAGGIGVTPFRSMIKYMSDTNDTRSVTMLYAERSAADIVYSEVFEQARTKIGTQTLYVLPSSTSNNSKVRVGRIDTVMIQQEIPDYHERLFYISGSQPMVKTVKRQLVSLGIRRHNIRTDYFSGYA